MDQNMRLARIAQIGTRPEIIDAAQPRLQSADVLVRIRAASLNFADLLKAEGKYQERAAPPFTPGLEGAGDVIEAAPGCGFAPGDRVAVLQEGTMAQVMAVQAENCRHIPASMSYEDAAGFQIVYGTSHLALTQRAGLASNETLIVLGAAGGVGMTAVEIGKALGARVIAVARGSARLDAVKAAGADEIIDSAEGGDLRSQLRALGGADVVYDPVGSAPGEAAFAALKRGGRFLIVGFAAGSPPALPLNHALVKNITLHGIYWGGYQQLDPLRLNQSLSELFAMYNAGKLHPVAGEVLPLEALDRGYALLRSRATVGKIIITM